MRTRRPGPPVVSPHTPMQRPHGPLAHMRDGQGVGGDGQGDGGGGGGDDDGVTDPADVLLASTLAALTASPPPTHMDLSRLHLGAPRWAQVATALASNTGTTALDVSYNQLGTDGGLALGQALAANTALVALDAGYTGLGAYGGAGLVAPLEQDNSSLRWLGLENNELGVHAGMALARALASNSGLTVLNVAHNELGDALHHIVNALMSNSTLLSLNLAGNLLAEDDGEPLDARPLLSGELALRELDLRDVRLWDESDEAGSEHGSGSHSEPADSRGSLGPASTERLFGQPLMWLFGNSVLTSLSLGGNAVAHSGWALAEVLANNATLSSLELDGRDCPLGSDDRGMLEAIGEALSDNAALTALSLPSHGLDATAGAILGAALSVNAALTALNLRNNSLGPDGGRALLGAFAHNTTLVALNVRSNAIGAAVKAGLSEALAANIARTANHPPRPLPPRVAGTRAPLVCLEWTPLAEAPGKPVLSSLNWLDLHPSMPAAGVVPNAGRVVVHVLVLASRAVYVGTGSRAVVAADPGAMAHVAAVYVDASRTSTMGELTAAALAAVDDGAGARSAASAVAGMTNRVRSSARVAELERELEDAHVRVGQLEANLRVVQAQLASQSPPPRVRVSTGAHSPALAAQLDLVTAKLQSMEKRALAAEERLSALARLGKLSGGGSGSGSGGDHGHLPAVAQRASPAGMGGGGAGPGAGPPGGESPIRPSARARLRLMVEMSNTNATKPALQPSPGSPGINGRR
ncbi:type III effector protein [Thecamonas trahens ATCC 50062]|uniref:Type III effector protein n=1 Tax=Thecamonas trahens ATCC 50062 TaxID=461836 RepID=A0A0L0DWA1_THETB|nr:type III effector protein [Thecamonas trahens ATCC 50062]KNC56457.1 type III effector protein [Thecamonas trahens ATCC 50062]|eukprot:XP_013760967.1 type III effector protein [Thecamonas trahens ATCC 50062]